MSDPEKRRIYDIRYESIKGSGGGARKTAAPQTNSAAKGSTTESEKEKQNRAASRNKKLQQLNAKRVFQDGDVFEAKRALNKLQAELNRLQEKIHKSQQEQAARETWWAYFTGRGSGTEKDKKQRERDWLDNLAAKRIKQAMLDGQKSRVEKFEAALQETRYEITKIEREIRKEAAEVEEAWRKAHQERQRREYEIRLAEAQRRREEEETRLAELRRRREEEALREMRQEQAKAAARRERARKEEEEQRQRQRREAERRKAYTKPTRDFRTANNTSGPCQHKGWWHKVECGMTCSRCQTRTNRFVFRCSCDMVACATCRDILKGVRSAKQKSAAGNYYRQRS